MGFSANKITKNRVLPLLPSILLSLGRVAYVFVFWLLASSFFSAMEQRYSLKGVYHFGAILSKEVLAAQGGTKRDSGRSETRYLGIGHNHQTS